MWYDENMFIREEIERLNKGHFIDGNSVTLLGTGQETFYAITSRISNAKTIVCLMFYIYRNDETGIALAELLKRKASEGIDVYILYDHLGSFSTPRSFWEDLQASGVKVHASHPFIWRSPLTYLHRDHRKLIVVDGDCAFTGGLNIANEYRGFTQKIGKFGIEPWRDTGILIKGPVASELLGYFSRAWEKRTNSSITNYPAVAKPAGDLPLLPIFATSARGRRSLRRLLYYGINHSTESITLTTAYFTPSWRMIYTLTQAVRRGVRVRLLVPGTSDIAAALYTGRYFFTRLLRAGVEIHTYQKTMLHAKSYVFDSKWCIVGSANLDFRSLRHNDEGNIGILSNNFALKMINMFENDIRNSRMIELEQWKKRPLIDKFLEFAYSRLRRRL